MAFASAVTEMSVFGNKRVHFGTYVSTDGTQGGDIDTGLRSCEMMLLQGVAAAVTASTPTVNATLPIAGSAVTIVTIADVSGRWMAVGY